MINTSGAVVLGMVYNYLPFMILPIYTAMTKIDDSIIEDKGAERQQDRQDVSMGVMRHEEYRAKWYGETVEQAKKNLPEQNQVME